MINLICLLFWIVHPSSLLNDTSPEHDWGAYAEYIAEYSEKLRIKLLNNTAASPIDLRVSKACGSKYDKVRVSVITQSSNAPQASFNWDYSERFKYKWTDNYLHSTLMTVETGSDTHLMIDNNKVDIDIPAKGKATGGILFADICVTQDQWCAYGGNWKVQERSTKFLNQVMKEDGMHWWYIIGDNFYDQSGWLTKGYYDDLTLDAKRKVSGVVMGNHDYWNDGSAGGSARSSDQLGYGQTQWYATESIWSMKTGGKTPFDLNDPGYDIGASPPVLNPDNGFWYHTMGNMGLIGYSGAYYWDTYESYFEQACQQFENDNVAHVLLLGHWDGQNHACQWQMDAPTALGKIKNLGSCRGLANKIHYVDGHTHCNHNNDKNNGFMIGANGWAGGCNGWAGGDQFGHLYVKSTDDGHVQFWYFRFASWDDQNEFDGIYNCIKSKGIDGCLDHATLWWSNGGPTPKPDDCVAMLSKQACDSSGCYSCGDRINWLENSEGKTPAQAYAQVAQEFPDICVCSDPPTIY